MHDDVKADVTRSLIDELSDSRATVTIVDTPEAARFFGQLMTSALQTRQIADEQIGAGKMLCWALLIEGRPYGLGMHLIDGRWHQTQQTFGPLNEHNETTEALDAIFGRIVDSINAAATAGDAVFEVEVYEPDGDPGGHQDLFRVRASGSTDAMIAALSEAEVRWPDNNGLAARTIRRIDN